MLVHDAPVAVDLGEADGEPEQETILVRRVAGRVGTAAHDRDCEGDVLGIIIRHVDHQKYRSRTTTVSPGCRWVSCEAATRTVWPSTTRLT